jgi:hypothetical protein
MLGTCHGGAEATVEDPDRYTNPDVCCDVPKENNNWTGVILNPLIDIPPFPIIFKYKESGEIEVGDQCPPAIQSKAQASIDKLFLNAPRLVRWRRELIEGLAESISNSIASDGKSVATATEEMAAALLSPTASQPWPRFFTCVRWYLGNAAENILNQSGYTG